MAKGNLSACLAETLQHEGGWADHPKDPGGATMRGVTLATFRRYVPGATKAQLRTISDTRLEAIYRDGYWRPLCGDDLPKGPDLAIFDFGVNSGVSRSAKYTQAIVGAAQDGQIGPQTLKAIGEVPPRELIKQLSRKRLGFVQALKIWETFGRGWSRRIASVEATALSWVSSKAELKKDAKAAAGAAAGQGAGAGGVVGTGAADQVQGVSGLPVGVIIVAVIAVAGILIIRAIINGQRASALADAARET